MQQSPQQETDADGAKMLDYIAAGDVRDQGVEREQDRILENLEYKYKYKV